MRSCSCRIRARTLQFILFDQLVPFIAGTIVINLMSNYWTSSVAKKSPLSPIVPFSVNLLPEQSVWTYLNITSAPEFNKLWIVTPTYNRPAQLAEITRLAQALQPVSSIIKWLIFDDFEKRKSKSNQLRLWEIVRPYKMQVQIQTTPKFTVNDTKRKKSSRGKGAKARRLAVEDLREQNRQGILYFADDDNTYDLEIFTQLLNIEYVGMWPVGAMNKLSFSSPIVHEGKIIGFYDGYTVNRKFPVDFAGIAINLNLINQNPDVNIKFSSGYMESYFLTDLKVQFDNLEPLASNCTKVMAWHTHTMDQHKNRETNPLKPLVDFVIRKDGHAALHVSFQNTNVAHLYHYYYQY